VWECCGGQICRSTKFRAERRVIGELPTYRKYVVNVGSGRIAEDPQMNKARQWPGFVLPAKLPVAHRARSAAAIATDQVRGPGPDHHDIKSPARF
jgi:hypothetical protein